MAKNETIQEDGLGVAEQSAEVTSTSKRKIQTPEEKAILVAGVEQLEAIGVSEKLVKVLPLVAAWNEEKESLQVVKEAVIESFGGSEALKDYFDAEFGKDVQGFQGILKTMPVLNNIKAFYARREGTTKKSKMIQVSISGAVYMVNQNYMAETAAMPADERKQLILAHADTKKVEVAEELL